MAQKVLASGRTVRLPVWVGPVMIALVYAILYTANYLFPLNGFNYSVRIWDWSQAALAFTAATVLIVQRRFVTLPLAGLGLIPAALSAVSLELHEPNAASIVWEAGTVWACFVASVILLRKQSLVSIPAFEPPVGRVLKSIVVGVLFAIPLAVMNNLYFSLNHGPVAFQNVFFSAMEALRPAIHEEIVFRFFILALCISLLSIHASRQWTIAIGTFLAVVPHSLNHLPDLLLKNPFMGLLMLLATSLLFGLPMAILQLKRNLESAIAFHWFIDFARFFFGY